MPSYDATGIPDSNVPNGHLREHCAANASDLTSISCGAKEQLRVERWEAGAIKASDWALYTVIQVNNGSPGDVQVGFRKPESTYKDLQNRLGLAGTDPFMARVNSQVVDVNSSDVDAEKNSEFVERLTDDGKQTAMIAIAPHGGDIEKYTDQQAEQVYTQLQLTFKCASVWLCKGWKKGGGAYDRWHITETDINEKAFPELNKVINREFTHAVAFHGWTYEFICIGGLAPKDLKIAIKTAIETAIFGSGIKVVTDEDSMFQNNFIPTSDANNFTGSSNRNIVNRLSPQGGIHIEQSLEARKTYGLDIANAVAGVLEQYLPVCGKHPVLGKVIGKVAIDPIALILEPQTYVLLTLPDPAPPSLDVLRAQIRQRVRAMGNEEKRLALARVRSFLTYAKALEQELEKGMAP